MDCERVDEGGKQNLQSTTSLQAYEVGVRSEIADKLRGHNLYQQIAGLTKWYVESFEHSRCDIWTLLATECFDLEDIILMILQAQNTRERRLTINLRRTSQLIRRPWFTDKVPKLSNRHLNITRDWFVGRNYPCQKWLKNRV